MLLRDGSDDLHQLWSFVQHVLGPNLQWWIHSFRVLHSSALTSCGMG